jgi:hypothetical protein
MKIFGQHEAGTLAQFAEVRGRAVDAALMADGHYGYVMPVGGVAAYRDQVSVVGVGFDVACLAAGTPVGTADGYHLPIERVMSDDAVTCWDGASVRRVAPCLGAVARGIRATVRVQLANGRAILASQAMGADLAYIGSPFIATEEANASVDYKTGIVEGRADDIVYSSLFTGVHGNYLRRSIEAAGLDPDHLPEGDLKTMDFGTGEGSKAKAWRDIWGSGQGIGAVTAVLPAADYIERLQREYSDAKRELALVLLTCP